MVYDVAVQSQTCLELTWESPTLPTGVITNYQV